MAITFHHIGIGVDNIPNHLPFKYDEDRQIKVAFVSIGGVTFELIAPTNPYDVTSEMGEQRGIYHVCFEVDNIKKSVLWLNSKVIHKPKKSKIFHGRRIAWVMNELYGLVELLEKKE